jgi:hypothetical protein
VGGRYLDWSRYRFRHPAQASNLSGIPASRRRQGAPAAAVSHGGVCRNRDPPRPSPAEVVAAREGAAVALSAGEQRAVRSVGRWSSVAHDTAPHYGVPPGWRWPHGTSARAAGLCSVRWWCARRGHRPGWSARSCGRASCLSTPATGGRGRPGDGASTPPCSRPGSRRWCGVGCWLLGDLPRSPRAGRHR